MEIAEWIVWAIACIVLLSFFLAALAQRDSGIRSHHMRHCLLLAPGILITIITPISKLHLLWWVPVTFFLNLLLSNLLLSLRLKRGLRDFEKRQHEAVIMVVDDEAQFLKLVSSILTNEAYEVDTAINGYEALDKVKKKKYDLLLTGIRMPGIDGFELYERIKKIAPSLANKTIIISGSIQSSDTKEFLLKYNLPYLPKPFEPRELVEGVNLLLNKSSQYIERLK